MGIVNVIGLGEYDLDDVDRHRKRIKRRQICPLARGQRHGEGGAHLARRGKKKKDKKKSKKEDSDEKSESKKKKKMNSTKNSMIMGWLDNSGETTSEVVNSEIDDVAAGSTESVSAPAGAVVGGEGDAKEDEYKRKLEEKKREHQRRKQEQEELEQERLNQLEQQEHDKKQREAELDAKFEEEKQRMEEKMSENLKKSLEEKEHKRKEEEEQRKARKDRIAAIMKRTREQNNAEQAANNGVSSTPGSELVGLQRTTSSESGTGSVTDMSSRVGSLLGSIRAKTGVVIGEPGQQKDTVNRAVPSVQ